MGDAPAADYAAATAAIRAAFRRASELVADEADPHVAFRRATELAEILRSLADEAANLRPATVYRIWEAEQLSLAALAKRIGVSKTRADQLLHMARPKEEKDG